MTETDVYPVGLLRDLRLIAAARRSPAGRRLHTAAWRHRLIWRTIARHIRAKNTRGLRNYLNGYLAEHIGHQHNAGRGWTRRSAARRVESICAEEAS